MSAGQPWIDAVMTPLSDRSHGGAYNRIYEAVGRGSESQGRALVAAILEVVGAEREGPETPTLERLLGPRGDLSTALAEALHCARTRDAGSHEVVTAITGAFDAVREIRAALSRLPSAPREATVDAAYEIAHKRLRKVLGAMPSFPPSDARDWRGALVSMLMEFRDAVRVDRGAVPLSAPAPTDVEAIRWAVALLEIHDGVKVNENSRYWLARLRALAVTPPGL